MRVLEHRRHSRRNPGGLHLNQAGVALARRVGTGLGPFDRVVTSPLPRAIETALALGFAVDAELRALLPAPDAVDGNVVARPPASFADYVRLVEHGGQTEQFARRQEETWRSELSRLPDGGRLLAISHGGVIEFGAAAALPTVARQWGAPLGLLEGVRLYLDGERWADAEILRVVPDGEGPESPSTARRREVTSSGEPSASIERSHPRRR